MKKFLLTFFYFWLFCLSVHAQKYWTGSGTPGQWSDANNWSTFSVPSSGDDVILDNTNVAGSYTVTLPAGSTTIAVRTLTITPLGSNMITVLLPATNTASPGFKTSGTGYSLVLNNNGIFVDSSKSVSAPTVTVIDSLKINNGGTYIHKTPRSSDMLTDRISAAPGTEMGTFVFDQPTSAGSFIALQGKNFGNVEFAVNTAGGTKIYSASGGSAALIIRNNLQINAGVNLNLQLTLNVFIGGNFQVAGNFNFSPSTAGSTDHSITFNGTANQTISGSGSLTFGSNFRNIKINKSSVVTLARDVSINSGDSLIVDTSATLNFGTQKILGAGIFANLPFSNLSLGDPNGINAAGISGNVQTGTRTFDALANYEYNGTGSQLTGTGLPSSVQKLIINKIDYNIVTLTANVNINDSLLLQKGFLFSTTGTLPTLRDTTGITSPNVGYARSFVLGPLKIEKTSLTSANFPIGKIRNLDTLFAPVSLSPANTTLKTYTAEYFPQPFINTTTSIVPIDHVSKLEYWKIESNLNSTLADAKVTLTWRPYSGVGNTIAADNMQALSDLVVAHYFDDGSGVKWNMEGGAPATFFPFSVNGTSNIDYGFISQLNSVSSTLFSYPIFTLGTRSKFNLLPVKFISFTATAKDNTTQISWTTEQDVSVEKYIIERSSDALNFNELKSITSLRQQSKSEYLTFDETPLSGWNYFRLKILDNNKSYYSKTIRVWFGKTREYLVYPNPAEKQINIKIPHQSSVTTLEIVNNSGQVVKKIQMNTSSITVNIQSLINGMYVIRFRNKTNVISQRFFKR